MAIGDPYITLDTFRAWAGKLDTGISDARITALLESASRQIEGMLNRQFNKSAAAEARHFDSFPLAYARSPYGYRGAYNDVLQVGDMVSVSAIATDAGDGLYDTAWDADTYQAGPLDAAAVGQPFTYIVATGSATWPIVPDSIRVTGIFGWPEVPAQIQQATYLLANRGLSLQRAPFGSTGAGELGAGLNMTAALTPMIREMVAPFNIVTT